MHKFKDWEERYFQAVCQRWIPHCVSHHTFKLNRREPPPRLKMKTEHLFCAHFLNRFGKSGRILKCTLIDKDINIPFLKQPGHLIYFSQAIRNLFRFNKNIRNTPPIMLLIYKWNSTYSHKDWSNFVQSYLLYVPCLLLWEKSVLHYKSRYSYSYHIKRSDNSFFQSFPSRLVW